MLIKVTLTTKASGGTHPVVGNEYTVDDYGAYYELSTCHSGAVVGGLGRALPVAMRIPRAVTPLTLAVPVC